MTTYSIVALLLIVAPVQSARSAEIRSRNPSDAFVIVPETLRNGNIRFEICSLKVRDLCKPIGSRTGYSRESIEDLKRALIQNSTVTATSTAGSGAAATLLTMLLSDVACEMIPVDYSKPMAVAAGVSRRDLGKCRGSLTIDAPIQQVGILLQQKLAGLDAIEESSRDPMIATSRANKALGWTTGVQTLDPQTRPAVGAGSLFNH